MTIQQAIDFFSQHQKSTVKKITLKSCGKLLESFRQGSANMSLIPGKVAESPESQIRHM